MGRVLRLRKNVLSTDSSDSSQGSDARNIKRCRTVLTDNSRNISMRNKSKKLDCVDASTSENSETANGIVNKVDEIAPVDQENISKECVTDTDSDACSNKKTVNKGDRERSVLVDKTNSILRNKLGDAKAKNKVHFSSVDRVRRITQRRISDFFHKDEFTSLHDGSKSPRSCQREHRKRILECICHPEGSDNQKACGSGCIKIKTTSNTKVHIPVYKMPAVNGDTSFHLTPPQVEDRNALYEFEVDENEPVVNVKKRRPFKTYKQRKRVCRMGENLKTNDFVDVPQRTMALRNDGQVDTARINYNEHNDSDVLNVTDVYDPHSSNSNKGRTLINSNAARNKVLQLKNNIVSVPKVKSTSNVIENKENIPRRVCHKKTVNTNQKVTDSQVLGITKRAVRGVNEAINKIPSYKNSEHPVSSTVNESRRDNHIPESSVDYIVDLVDDCDSNLAKSNTVSKSSCKQNICDEDVLQNSVLSNKEDNQERHPPDVVDAPLPPPDLSVCTTASQSPLPEYSRIDDGIQVGPIYTSSSINCSVAEYNNSFIRGITASTPFRAVNSPARSNNNNYQVRLSGGELSNRFSKRLLDQSDDEDDEDFFGFGDNESREESLRYAHLNRQRPVEEQIETNEPVQKITVNEIISLLKQDVYGHKKSSKVKNKVTFGKIYDNSKESCNSYNEELLNGSDSFSSPGQPTLSRYVNNTSNETSKVIIEEPDGSFSKPPRRSYTCTTPRRAKRIDYKHDEPLSEDEVQDVAPKKWHKKVKKVSKKEEKEMERLAALMNSQFQEVDKFNLVVE